MRKRVKRGGKERATGGIIDEEKDKGRRGKKRNNCSNHFNQGTL